MQIVIFLTSAKYATNKTSNVKAALAWDAPHHSMSNTVETFDNGFECQVKNNNDLLFIGGKKKKKPSAKLKDILYQCSKVVNFKTEFENKK